MRRDARRARRWVVGVWLALLAAAGVLEVPEEVRIALFPLHSEPAVAQYGTSRRVARRTSRRTSSRQNAMYDAATPDVAVVAVPAGARYITALPGGCVATAVGGITYQQCGSVRYRPYYQGDTLVYVVE